jgi:hypothetical protein
MKGDIMDPRMSYFYFKDGQCLFLPAPDEEFDVSACFTEGRDDSDGEGWPDGITWHLESKHSTLAHYNDLGGNPFRDIDHWLTPLTGYTRNEFLAEFLQDDFIRFSGE